MVGRGYGFAAQHRFLVDGRQLCEQYLHAAVDELLPSACHVQERYANNPIENRSWRLSNRLRPMRDLKQLRSVRVISVAHALSRMFAAAATNLPPTLTPGIASRLRSPTRARRLIRRNRR